MLLAAVSQDRDFSQAWGLSLDHCIRAVAAQPTLEVPTLLDVALRPHLHVMVVQSLCAHVCGADVLWGHGRALGSDTVKRTFQLAGVQRAGCLHGRPASSLHAVSGFNLRFEFIYV